MSNPSWNELLVRSGRKLLFNSEDNDLRNDTLPSDDEKRVVNFSTQRHKIVYVEHRKDLNKKIMWYTKQDHEAFRLNIIETLKEWHIRAQRQESKLDADEHCLRGLEEYYTTDIPGYTLAEYRHSFIQSVLREQQRQRLKKSAQDNKMSGLLFGSTPSPKQNNNKHNCSGSSSWSGNFSLYNGDLDNIGAGNSGTEAASRSGAKMYDSNDPLIALAEKSEIGSITSRARALELAQRDAEEVRLFFVDYFREMEEKDNKLVELEEGKEMEDSSQIEAKKRPKEGEKEKQKRLDDDDDDDEEEEEGEKGQDREVDQQREELQPQQELQEKQQQQPRQQPPQHQLRQDQENQRHQQAEQEQEEETMEKNEVRHEEEPLPQQQQHLPLRLQQQLEPDQAQLKDLVSEKKGDEQELEEKLLQDLETCGSTGVVTAKLICQGLFDESYVEEYDEDENDDFNEYHDVIHEEIEEEHIYHYFTKKNETECMFLSPDGKWGVSSSGSSTTSSSSSATASSNCDSSSDGVDDDEIDDDDGGSSNDDCEQGQQRRSSISILSVGDAFSLKKLSLDVDVIDGVTDENNCGDDDLDDFYSIDGDENLDGECIVPAACETIDHIDIVSGNCDVPCDTFHHDDNLESDFFDAVTIGNGAETSSNERDCHGETEGRCDSLNHGCSNDTLDCIEESKNTDEILDNSGLTEFDRIQNCKSADEILSVLLSSTVDESSGKRRIMI